MPVEAPILNAKGFKRHMPGDLDLGGSREPGPSLKDTMVTALSIDFLRSGNMAVSLKEPNPLIVCGLSTETVSPKAKSIRETAVDLSTKAGYASVVSLGTLYGEKRGSSRFYRRGRRRRNSTGCSKCNGKRRPGVPNHQCESGLSGLYQL